MTREVRSSQQKLGYAGKTLSGYAVLFNVPTNVGGIWLEIVKPGAFRAALDRGDDVLALYSHALCRLLGRRSSGTLRLMEDDKGLKVEIDLPDTTDGRDVAELVGRGDLQGMSYGFQAVNQQWDESGEIPIRTLMTVDLFEVTVTADPAQPDTEIGLRDRDRYQRESRQKTKTGNRMGYFLRKAQLDQRARGL